ncbi:hypothetical protein FGIG_06534 [Fasciola gigantica]|uniref:Uncharacterized protein n=1 Tax=Fasciola gigantica TaxID=46835 RepID=A0A504ZCE2_FASGI|nr:hypothetical protein FGIG_06534 [Fasciola gigantica]
MVAHLSASIVLGSRGSRMLTEEERTRKLHRKEPLGSDRAGRTYWYIARRVLVEPTDFTQREPCLPGILDGVYDPHWQQAYADRFLDEHDSDEDSDEATSLCSANGDGDELPERPLRRVRCNPMVEYATEPPVYYYSTVEQVIELRARLSMRWEPWLCQRLDALMPRIQVEMLVTQQLTTEGLDIFCCLRPDHERVALSQALDYVEPGAALSHVTRVFALLEAEARQSQLRMDLGRDRVEDALEYRSIDSLLNAPPTLGLKVVKSRAPDTLPDDSLSELCDGEENSILGVLIACDANTCFVRNHDGLFVRVNRPSPVMHDVCGTLFTSEERSVFALPDPELTSDTSPESSHLSSPRLRAYRLSDEGTWRSWSNLYTVGVWLGSEQQQVTDDTRPDGAAKSDGAERKTLAHHSVRKEGDEELGKSSAALVNVMFSRAQVAEDRERKRIMGNKFSFTDTTTELWNYVEPPLLASFFTDLVELLKCPCALDDNLFRPDWPATPWQSVDVLRLTIAYMEAQNDLSFNNRIQIYFFIRIFILQCLHPISIRQLPLAFFSPAWCSLRKHWLSRLIEAKTLAELVNSLATLEASIRPLCYQRIWYGSVGHLIFERSTAAQREEDRRVRQLDRSASLSTAGANNLSQNLIRTKTPRPIRHTVWKSRGEEYRRLGGDGWMWLSSTRRSTSEESKMLLRTYPGISELYHRSDSSRPRTRGLQHGIGWGVCPEYLKGEVAVKPPKASECRGHVLHPITGIPLYLNTRRTPYIIPEETLRQLVKTIVSSPSTSESSCKVDDDVKSVPDEVVDNRILTGDVSVLETDALSPKLDAPGCPSSPNPNSSALDSSKASDDSQTKQSLPEPDNEPLVMNVSYGLTERIHFPPAVVRPAVHSSSRRLRFRLDDLLSRRVAAAAADKAAAESAKMNIKTLDHDVRELEQEKSRLEIRLSELADEAQEARSAKAKAVKARQAAGPSPLPVSVLQPQVRSAPFVVSTAGNRSVNLAALQQDTPSVSRRLIEHSFISTSSGNRYRAYVSRPSTFDLLLILAALRDADSPNLISVQVMIMMNLTRMAESAESMIPTTIHPKNMVLDLDFDDLEDEEDDVNNALSKNRGSRRNRRCEEDDNDDDHGSDDELDDENSNVGPRPRTRFPLSARPRITRMPQFDGAGDSASSSAEEGTENLEFEKEPSDSSNGPTPPKNPCLDDVQTLESSQVPKEDAATPRHGGVINRIVRLVRSVDEQNTPTTTSNALTQPPVTDTDSSVPYSNLLILATFYYLQSQPSSAVTASNSTDSALPNASSTLSSTAGSVVVNLPAGFRLLSANPTPTAAVATTASINSAVPVRLVGTNLTGNVSSGSTAISSTTIAPTTANAIPITVTGPNTVRLVLHSSRINSTSSDCLQTITLTPVPSQDTNSAFSCTNSSTTTTILSESGAAVSDATSRCQPAILRRTLVGVPTGELKTGEIRVITLPHQSVASLVATNTARQISAAGSRSAPLIEDRAAPSAQRSFAPRILPRGIGVAPGLLNVGMMVQSNETVVALERAVTEATTRLNKVGAEAVEIKKQLLEVGQKLKQMTARLSQLRDLQECAGRPTSAAYSLLHKRRIDPEMDDSSNEKPGGDETYAKEENSTEEKQVVLPAELPPVNTYVWPPLEWSSEQKRGFPSVSSLFRLHPKNLRGLILAAGRRELPGFDAEKKRLVQVVWPYPTAKPSLMEAWRLRLSQLRLKPTDNGGNTDSNRMVHFPGQGLAHLFLLLRSLWHMIRWDDVLGEPADGEHILDDEGHPCLREDRFWLRANYLVQLTHTNPVHDRSSRSKNSRGSVTRSGRHSTAGGRHPWTGTELRKRHSSRRSGKQRSRRSGNDPDYNPSEDEPWRFTSRRSRRRARGTDDDSDDDDANRNPNDGDDSDGTSDSSGAAGHIANRISRIEEVWMSEDSLRMWEIRTFMNAYLPPQSSDYLGGLLNDGRSDKVPGDALMKARRRPARLPHPKAETCQTTEQQRKDQLTKSEIIMNNEHVLDLPFSVLFNRDAQSMNRRGAFEPVNLASGRSVTRRSRPPPEIPVVSSEVLEAKARARSLAATRAARASVLARKAKAERAAMEQHARTLRTQLITRRRLYLNLARALADAAVEKQKQNLFAQCQSDSADEDDSDSIQTSPVQPRLAPSHVATLKQTPGPIIRRPRGRPPTSGRYRVNRGLRRPLTSSQVSYQSTPSNVASGLGTVDKTPLATIKNVLDNEEQENKPEWTFSRCGATAYRPRSVRRGSIPNRRGRPRGRTLSRASAPTPETLVNRTPVPLSPSHDDSNDLSSAPSTPSTCPALGDSRLEALLTMPEGGADSMQWSPRRSAKPEQPIYFSRGACDSVRGARGARRRVGRPPGRVLRGQADGCQTNAGEMSSDLTPIQDLFYLFASSGEDGATTDE